MRGRRTVLLGLPLRPADDRRRLGASGWRRADPDEPVLPLDEAALRSARTAGWKRPLPGGACLRETVSPLREYTNPSGSSPMFTRTLRLVCNEIAGTTPPRRSGAFTSIVLSMGLPL